MARKKGTHRRRPKGRYIKGNVDEGLSLGTLAGQTLVSATFDETAEERTLISSMKAVYSLANMTPGATIGPIMVGVAHSDYSDAEIEAVIEQAQSWNEGDKIGQEIAKRLVRTVGIFEVPDDAADAVVLNDGKPVYTRLGWILTTGKTLKLWSYNLGAAALATTDPTVRAQGHANLWVQ